MNNEINIRSKLKKQNAPEFRFDDAIIEVFERGYVTIKRLCAQSGQDGGDILQYSRILLRKTCATITMNISHHSERRPNTLYADIPEK